MTFYDLYRRYHLAAAALFTLGVVTSVHDYDKHTNPDR
jgi:hypothetical protein